MRLSLRSQLAFLLVISGGIGLAVLAVATWVVNYDFVLRVAASRLEITASLKAAQVANNLELMQTAATFLTNRITIQDGLARYNNGSDLSSSNWNQATTVLESALGNTGPLQHGLVHQAQIYAANGSGPAGTESVMRATGNPYTSVRLPYLNTNGQPAYLGDANLGYPPSLYPNLTISDKYDAQGRLNPTASYDGEVLGLNSTLVLGPMMVNSTFSLISFTLPVLSNSDTNDILGWATVVTDGRLIVEVVRDVSGLGTTGVTLLVGPVKRTNKFPKGITGSLQGASTAEVSLLIPLPASAASRHPDHVVGSRNLPFPAKQYPAVELALVEDRRGTDDVGSLMRTRNEDNKRVSVGFSTPSTNLVDWIVVVEQARHEVWEPIYYLRTIILACFFGVIGFICIVSFPLAHWAVLPIMRLRAATEQTISPPGGAYSDSKPSMYSSRDVSSCTDMAEKESSASIFHRKLSFFAAMFRKSSSKRQAESGAFSRDEEVPRTPGKVEQRETWIKDEMSDLITTFNQMSDELMAQYTKLEDRVRQRTSELEHSKKAAEAANESKTRFVANVSHELRTPLNGILGLAAVCMAEDDPERVKGSLETIEKSGNLLLRTLNDLLSFSTNQLGHRVVTLDEKEFAIRDVETQTMAIFGQQSKANSVDLQVVFEEMPGNISGTDKLNNLRLHGDIHRILQIVINLVGNSLKFTPQGGSVTLRIRCLAERPPVGRAVSTTKSPITQQQNRACSEAGTANFINPRDVGPTHGLVQESGRQMPAGKDVYIELEVEDTGPGIEEEMQARIFEPFVQADAGLSRRHNGTGLGLAISTQLVALMDGTIRLRSKVGVGSTFTARIPLRIVFNPSGITPRSSYEVERTLSRIDAEEECPSAILDRGKAKSEVAIAEVELTPESSKEDLPTTSKEELRTTSKEESLTTSKEDLPTTSPATNKPILPIPLPDRLAKTSHTPSPSSVSSSASIPPLPDFSTLRVLVAEDNKINQEVIQRMLKLEKIKDITLAADGQIALDTVTSSSPAERPFDLILMDIQMPNMDGLQATREIRKTGFTNPIVALTAFAEQSNVEDCFASGMDFFLAKPVKRGKLKEMLVEVLSSPKREKGKENDEES